MPQSADHLQSQREALRRGLWRASLASIVVLLIVVALAVGVAWKARQSQTDAERARVATQRAESELWNAKLNEARARRIAGGPGARVESAQSVRELVQSPALERDQVLALRQEAIAQLALVDVQVVSINWLEKDRDGDFFWNDTFKRYVKAGSTHRITVRSHPGNEVVRQFEVYTNAVLRRAMFSPDDRLLAVGFTDGQVRVWRIDDGALVLSTRGTSASGYFFPFFSPNSRLVAVVSSQTNWSRGDGLRLYDLISGEIHLKAAVTPTFSQFSSDGQYLAVALRGEVRILRTETGDTAASLKVPLEGYTLMAWHPHGQRLAITWGNGRLWVWDIWSDAAPRTFVGHPNVITDLSFSPDGSMLLTYGWDSIANFWEPLSGRRLLAERRVGVRRFSREGQILAHMSRPRREGGQTLLSRSAFRTVASTGNAAQPTEGVWIHPRNRLIAAAYPEAEGIRVWTFPDGAEVARLPAQWAQFTFDGTALLTFTRDAVRYYEIPSRFSGCGGATEWRDQVIYRPGGGRAISKGMLAGDGKTLVIGENENVVLYDLAARQELKRFKANCQHGSLSLDGQWLVTCKHQDAGSLLNVSTGEKVRSVPAMSWAEFSPNGRHLAILDAAALRIFNTNTWEQISKMPLDVGSGTPPGFCFAPDGQTFAVAYNRQEVRLHETASGRELATLSPPDPTPITGGAGLAFSSDGRWLIAARTDGDIVAWELPVIRTELAKLGLDWGKEDGLGPELQTVPTASRASFAAISAPTAGFLAALFAIGAGLFIFIMQRRMIAGYQRIEAVTVEQRAKLDTAQAELMHGQKMRALGTLAAGIAHDFNNLLSVIRLSNQLAAEETKATGAARENMDAVECAVTQGETIVQSMLGYSRAASETSNEYSVAAALSETVAMLGKKFLSGIVLKLEVAPDLPPVAGARGRLEQMLLNLVVNSAEAMRGQGTLSLAAHVVSSAAECVLKPRAAPAYIEIVVSDSGPGISKDVLPRIFEPFFTTKNAGATPGTGLGLSTVYTMAEQDGLGLGVQSREGNGTTFKIIIPVGATNPVIDDRIQTNIGVDV